MPYNNIITRAGTQALVPEVVSDQILGTLASQSAALTMFQQIRMATSQTRMPILAALPTAYFVNGDTGLKQTTQASWDNKYLNVEELAGIVPIAENVLDDTSFDVWGSIMPLLQQAIGRALDAAVFFGVNKPASWPNAIVTDAITAGNAVTRGTAAASAGGISGDFSNLYATVEADGYDVSGLIANRTYKGLLRNVRDTMGRPLLDDASSIYGAGVNFPMRGLWPAVVTTGQQNVEAIAGDFSQAILGVRQDVTYKILTEASIYDSAGALQYALAQQDMVALRVTFRCAFQIANTLNYDKPGETDATRYPFGVMRGPVNP